MFEEPELNMKMFRFIVEYSWEISIMFRFTVEYSWEISIMFRFTVEYSWEISIMKKVNNLYLAQPDLIKTLLIGNSNNTFYN